MNIGMRPELLHGLEALHNEMAVPKYQGFVEIKRFTIKTFWQVKLNVK
jgi:hypothetical protein